MAALRESEQAFAVAEERGDPLNAGCLVDVRGRPSVLTTFAQKDQVLEVDGAGGQWLKSGQQPHGAGSPAGFFLRLPGGRHCGILVGVEVAAG